MPKGFAQGRPGVEGKGGLSAWPLCAAFPAWRPSQHLATPLISYLTAHFFRGSEESRRAGPGRGEASAQGAVLGVSHTRLERRRPVDVGKADRRLALRGSRKLLASPGEASPETRLAGVLWITTLATIK